MKLKNPKPKRKEKKRKEKIGGISIGSRYAAKPIFGNARVEG